MTTMEDASAGKEDGLHLHFPVWPEKVMQWLSTCLLMMPMIILHYVQPVCYLSQLMFHIFHVY